jgi:glutamate synthase domain-containing protein 3
MQIDAQNLYYRDLNRRIREAAAAGEKTFELRHINGQRYIADGLKGDLTFHIHGVPGQDLGAFMQGPKIQVYGNAQDGVANTMDDGKIVIHGMAGDVLGYGMRGGKVFIRGDVGYRVGIHMKAFKDKVPVIVIGGKAGDFLGEYMAGGIIILLGMFGDPDPQKPLAGIYLGTGMHGGIIYIRGQVDTHQLGAGLMPHPVEAQDRKILKSYLKEFSQDLNLPYEEILKAKFTKVFPYTHRPYGNLYAY